MKIKTLIRRLFEWAGKQKLAENSLPASETKVNEPLAREAEINATQIQIDTTNLLTMLISYGYTPETLLLLIGNIYGTVTGSAPESLGVTPEDLEKKFFELCAKERIVRKTIAECAPDNVVSIDRRKMN